MSIPETEHSDIKCLVKGIIEVFVYKIHKLPSAYAIKIYNMLLTFLEHHYSRPKIFENCPIVRYMVSPNVCRDRQRLWEQKIYR